MGGFLIGKIDKTLYLDHHCRLTGCKDALQKLQRE
jgi:hypothetical protein